LLTTTEGFYLVEQTNGTLIKTSSYPSGFVAQSINGAVELRTTVEDPAIQFLH
jgi:hypothetical protein